MTGRLTAQLAHLFDREAEAIAQTYAWPPRAPLTPEENLEVERLWAIRDELFERAAAAGQHGGTDYVFGEYEGTTT